MMEKRQAIRPTPPHVLMAGYLGIALVSLSLVGSQFVAEFRYLKYIMPALFIIIWLNYQPSRIYRRSYVLPFLLLPVYAVLTVPMISEYKDFFFILAYVSFFVFFSEFHISLQKLNILLMALFLLVELINHGSSIMLIFLNALGSNVEGGLEQNEFGFIFGLFAVYFIAIKRNILLAMLNVLLCIVSMKRIAVLAVIVVVLLLLVPKKVVERILSPVVMLCVNVGVVLFLIAFTQGYFDDVIKNLTGLSANAFSMGRQTLYGDVVGVIANGNLFGSGVGAAYEYALTSAGSVAGGNLHSDLIKIVLEYGWIVFVLFIYFLYKNENLLMKYLALYINILFVSDNVLIYVSVMFFYLLIVSQVRVDLVRVQYEGENNLALKKSISVKLSCKLDKNENTTSS